jgi:hypothetical protein
MGNLDFSCIFVISTFIAVGKAKRKTNQLFFHGKKHPFKKHVYQTAGLFKTVLA